MYRTDVDCLDPGQIAHGRATLSTNATYYGAAVQYECDANHRLDGVSRRLCLEDGNWGHEAPACVEITCAEPDLSVDLIVEPATWSPDVGDATNAEAKNDIANSTGGGRSVGSLATFRCPRGRLLIGNETRTCLPNGHWTGRSPRCEPVDCSRPPSIDNGRVIVINESTVYGGAAEYHCVPGHTRIGPYLRKCMDGGAWSGTEPRCELAADSVAQESGGLGTGMCGFDFISAIICANC